MNSRTLAILGIVTVVVAALAYWSLRGPRPSEAPKSAGASPVLTSKVFVPGLTEKADQVGSITVKGAGKESVVKKSGDEWVLENRGGYPVDITKVRDAVQSIADLLIFEAKTTDPAKFEQLWLEDPSDKAESKSRLVTFGDTSNKVIASVIVGSSAASFGNTPGTSTTYGVFVRRSGETQSYLAKSRLDARATLDPDPSSWLKRDVVNVEAQRVKSVTISHPDGAKVLISKDKKDDRDYALANMPAGRELKFGGAPAQVAGALSFVNFDDVAPISEVAEGATPSGAAEFRTFDGLVVSVDTSTKNGTAWVAFTSRYEPPPQAEPVPSDQPPPAAPKPEAEVRKEVQELNDRLSKWAFALPSIKVKQILSTTEDLLKPADQTPVKIDQGAKLAEPHPSGAPVVVPEK